MTPRRSSAQDGDAVGLDAGADAGAAIRGLRITLVVVGAALLGIGAYALLSQVDLSTLPNLLLWLAAGLVIHDAIAMPIVAAIGVVLAKTLPNGSRQLVQAGLIVAAMVSLVALPVVIGGGKNPANPSLLPLDYGRNLVIVLALIGVVVGLLVISWLVRDRFTRDQAGPKC